MATYTKETALYDTGAIASDIQEAGAQVTKYITAVGDDGIKVHPYNSTTGQADTKNYTKIDANGLEVYQENQTLPDSSILVAKFGSEGSSIGDVAGSHVELDYNSFRLIDQDGETYFYISDPRGESGEAAIVQTYIADGVTQAYYFDVKTNNAQTVRVYINGTVTTDYEVVLDTYLIFSVAPAKNAEVMITYTTTSPLAKYYTIGHRKTGNMGAYSVAEGYDVIAAGTFSHTEGYTTEANGTASHAEGSLTIAHGGHSHAEGSSTKAYGAESHAEGSFSVASGRYSHSEGETTAANGKSSHAEGASTRANGTCSHAGGHHTRSSGDYQTAIGKYNLEDPACFFKTSDTSIKNKKTYYTYSDGAFSQVTSPTATNLPNYYEYDSTTGSKIFIIGNGDYETRRSNAFTVDWDGRIECGDYAGNFKSIFDIFYPVGSYYETSDTSFDPNTAWGGTWSLETAGQVHVSAGTGYTAGSTGGSATHTLTSGEVPLKSHTHTVGANNDPYDSFVTALWGDGYSVSRRSIKPGTSTAVTNNYYGAGALTRYRTTNSASESATSAISLMQPYIAVNRWHRTA